MKTKYGNAKIRDKGYYRITSEKEGNYGKYLHRLIFEDYHNCKLDENDVIHHADFDKTNNHPSNLICMSRKAHQILHSINRTFSEETKKKISESKKGKYCGENHPMYNKHFSEESKINMSKSRNTTKYFRVSKHKCKTCKQGFQWIYQYYDENGKRKNITSVNIEKLEEKVKVKGLLWRKIL